MAGRRGRALLVLSCGIVGFLLGCSRSETKVSQPWNPKTAASYLDVREVWWMQWPQAKMSRGTFCVSCHTSVPYTLARPSLRNVLGEKSPANNETELLENVRARVRLGTQADTYYTDEQDGPHKTAEAKGTEAVLNAFILANHDAETGRLSDDIRIAFANMWALQQQYGEAKGAWSWLQFNLEPWEADDSVYYGATLAAVAVGIAPDNYRSTAEIQDRMALLRDYLNREYPKQSVINRVGLLWASAKIPGLIDTERQRALVSEVFEQQCPDGGWSLSKLSKSSSGWSLSSWRTNLVREIRDTVRPRSDGYATGLIVYTLLQSGINRDNAQIERGLEWLKQNQQESDGRWEAYAFGLSPDPASIAGKFRSDAATAFAVLALTEAEKSQTNRAAIR
jgi:squalene-hopene/tetraprenyl-beta-curcumene cyclase